MYLTMSWQLEKETILTCFSASIITTLLFVTSNIFIEDTDDTSQDPPVPGDQHELESPPFAVFKMLVVHRL